jgi:hypothetical protein
MSVDRRLNRLRRGVRARLETWFAVLGDDVGRVDVEGTRDKVYVRFVEGTDGNGNARLSAPVVVNAGVSGSYLCAWGLGVRVGYDDYGELEVKRSDARDLRQREISPRVLNHARPDNQFVSLAQLSLFASYAVGTRDQPSKRVTTYPLLYLTHEGFTFWRGSELQADKLDLAPFVPAVGQHRLACVFLSSYTNTLHVYASTPKALANAITIDDLNECWAQARDDEMPSGSFVLVGGEDVTSKSLAFDARQLINVPTPVGYSNPLANNTLIWQGRVLRALDVYQVDALLVVDGLLIVESSAVSASALTVREVDSSPNVSSVSELVFPNASLTDLGSGVVQVSFSASSSLVVEEQDGSPSVAGVTKLKFDNTTVTDEGSGVVSIANPPLRVREVDNNPNVSPVREIVVPNASLTNLGSGAVQLDFPSSSALTVREIDGSPNVAGVTTIEFTNTTVTDLGAGVVRVDAAPAASRYVTYQSDANLTNAVVVPAWADHPDRAANAPANATFQQHFDAPSGITWLGSPPTTWDENTTHKSHLYIAESGGDRYGYWSWAPAGNFDARCKLVQGRNADVTGDVRLSIRSADNVREVAVRSTAIAVSAITRVGTTTTQVGSTINLRFNYFRITRAGGTITWWASDDGRAWVFVASTAFTISVARIGVGTNGANLSLACDWIWATG